VQRAGDPRAFSGWDAAYSLRWTSARAFMLGEHDLLAAKLCKRQVGDLEVGLGQVAVGFIMLSPCNR